MNGRRGKKEREGEREKDEGREEKLHVVYVPLMEHTQQLCVSWGWG